MANPPTHERPAVRLLGDLKFTVGGEHGDEVEYVPFAAEHAAGWHVGYRATMLATGQVTYIYLNASDHAGDDPESRPNVFLYEGPACDPAQDTSHHYYDLDFSNA